MPRTITTTVTVYKFEELTEAAQDKAVGTVSAKLNGDWWDQHDIDAINETIVYGFARALRTPGWDTFGEGDFPGIPGVELLGWDLERGQSVDFRGRLTRENAPALPWTEYLDLVTLGGLPDYDITASVFVHGDVESEKDTLEQAVADALHEAWRSGRDQMDYLASDEHAREWIEDNEPEFTVDGQLA